MSKTKKNQMPDEDVAKFRDMTTRSLHLRADTIDEENRSVETVISTSNPVMVFDWRRYEPIREILVTEGRANNTEQVPMLDSHLRFRIRDVLGSIRNIRNEGEETVGTAVFARLDNSEEAWSLVRDGHITDISAGYHVLKFIDIEPGAEAVVNGRTYRNDDPKLRLRVSYEWQLKEGSLVAIGADEASKIRQELTEIEGRKREMPEEIVNTAPEQRSAPVPAAPPAPVVDTEKIQRETRAQEVARIQEINAIGDTFAMREAARKAIQNGATVEAFRKEVMDKLDTSRHIDSQQANLGLEKKDIQNYSFSRALIAQMTGDWSKAGLELEMSRAIAEKTKREPNGIFIPPEILANRKPDMSLINKRALTTASEPELVGTSHLASSFIDLLRNQSKIMQLGANTLTGLVGNVSIPRQTGGSTVGWVAEGSGQALSDQTFGALALDPKNAAGNTQMSRQMILQANPAIESLVLNDLLAGIGLLIDLGAISGSGAANDPTGILNTVGIGDVVGTAFDWDAVVEFETDVAAANGLIGPAAYLGGASVVGLLKTIKKDAGSGLHLMENGMMNGYPVEMSNQVPASTLIFGVFSTLIVAMWGGLDVLVDPYTQGATGSVVIRAFQSVDVGLRYPVAFSASDEVAA